MALASNASAQPCAKPFRLGQLSDETLAVWRECSIGLCYYMTSPIFRLMDVMKSLVGGTFAEMGIKGGEGKPHWYKASVWSHFKFSSWEYRWNWTGWSCVCIIFI